LDLCGPRDIHGCAQEDSAVAGKGQKEQRLHDLQVNAGFFDPIVSASPAVQGG
jgi:hypothetical protein